MTRRVQAQQISFVASAGRGEEGSPTVPIYNFPFSLHRFITETAASKERDKQIAGWSASGDQFFINYDDSKLLSQLMEPYFRRKSLNTALATARSCDSQCFCFSCCTLLLIFLIKTADGNYASLRRQLNTYGFIKGNGFWKRKETAAGILFHRDSPHDIGRIKPRHTGTSRRSEKRKDPPKAHDSSVLQDAPDDEEAPDKKDPPEDALQALFWFLEVCSTSHPDLIGWNITGTAFRMEVFHTEVQTLLKTYFPGTCGVFF